MIPGSKFQIRSCIFSWEYGFNDVLAWLKSPEPGQAKPYKLGPSQAHILALKGSQLGFISQKPWTCSSSPGFFKQMLMLNSRDMCISNYIVYVFFGHQHNKSWISPTINWWTRWMMIQLRMHKWEVIQRTLTNHGWRSSMVIFEMLRIWEVNPLCSGGE